MKIPIIILKLFVIGALFIISTQNLHLGVSQDRSIFFTEYFSWIGSVAHQAVSATGYITKFQWLPASPKNTSNPGNASG